MRCDNGAELFPVVDEAGNVVGSATRAECHGGGGLLHPVVHLIFMYMPAVGGILFVNRPS